jgi:hypothetical protein
MISLALRFQDSSVPPGYVLPEERGAKYPAFSVLGFWLCREGADLGDVVNQVRHVAIFDTHGPMHTIHLPGPGPYKS